MSVAARPESAGKTRTCPHCKATILESLTICPGCLHHLRFDQEAAKRQVAAASALRVEGVIAHPSTATTPWEYFVVISVRNERGEEVTRQVVNVGALQNSEKRTFTLSVDVMPQQAVVVANKPAASAFGSRTPAVAAARPAAGASASTGAGRPGGAAAGVSSGVKAPAGALPGGQAAKPSPGPPAKPSPGNLPPIPPVPPRR